GLTQAGLVFHIVGEVRESVALGFAALVGYGFVAASETDRLERKEADLLRIIQRELDDAADLLIINTVDDSHNRHDLDTGTMQVIDRLQLHVEQIPDLAVRVRGIADAIELQVGIAQSSFGRLLRKLEALCEFNSVGRSLNRVISNLASVADRV